MSKPSLPSPHEPFVDENNKVSDVWYRYLTQGLAQANALTDVVGGLSTGTTGISAVAFSSFATQTDQEAGASSTAVVTSSVQQYHPSAAKAWGHVSMAGTVATLTGYGVNTVASTATGKLRVDLSVSFSSTAYGIIAIASPSQTSFALPVTISSSVGVATTTFTLQHGSTASIADPVAYYFACYGDQ